MRTFILFLILLAPLPTFAGEELFTVKVEYFEDSSRPGFDAKTFQGRQWDLKAVLGSFEPRLQWSREVSRSPAAYQGNSLCLRILKTTTGQELGPFVSNEYRIRVLKNLLAQLRLRQDEMRRAGALYRVTYPSGCGKPKV
jgi:hypothetical protein